MVKTAMTNDASARLSGSFCRGKLAPYIWLTCLLLLLGFAFQGTRAVWSTDEGRYTENALQMIYSGDYLVPAYSADRMNFTKPPMHYWAIAASVNVFGHNTWAVRTPNALAFVLTALMLCLMGRLFIPEKPWLPGLIYGCSLAPFIAANVVSTDTLLTFFEALALLGFVYAEFGGQAASRRNYIRLMWAGFGFAFLTKGPPGLLPLLAIVPFMVKRDGWRSLGRVFSPSGLAVFLVTGFSWYLVVILHHPWLLHYFLYYEVYDRIFTATHNRSPQWYGWMTTYGPAFIVGTMPWWLSLFRGMRSVASLQRLRQWWHAPGPRLFLLLWFLIPLIVFCTSRSRLPVYVLPLFMPLSLMIAIKLQHRVNLTLTRQRLLLGVWVLCLIALKAGVGIYVHPASDNRLRAEQLAAVTGNTSYSALVFVEDTAVDVGIEEHTPWGMRLYIDKPIFGIAWRKPGSAEQLCRLMHSNATLLYAVENGVDSAALETAMRKCSPHEVRHVGTWRDYSLEVSRN